MNNALQLIGNKNKARTITDPAYLETDVLTTAVFKDILEPHATLFHWRSVSDIAIKSLKTTIKNISTNAKRLQYPPSPEQISVLTEVCRIFLTAYKNCISIKNRLYK